MDRPRLDFRPGMRDRDGNAVQLSSSEHALRAACSESVCLCSEDLEEIMDMHHLERLGGERRWIDQLRVPAEFFGLHQGVHDSPNPGGIDRRHRLEVQDQEGMFAFQGLLYGSIEAIQGFTKDEPSLHA